MLYVLTYFRSNREFAKVLSLQFSSDRAHDRLPHQIWWHIEVGPSDFCWPLARSSEVCGNAVLWTVSKHVFWTGF